jgi:putative tryptophan/tyrosine transport system substrate-binding protein
MTKLVRLLLLVSGVLATTFASAQEKAGIPRVGFLAPGYGDSDIRAGLLRGLRDLGYVDGRNFIFDPRYWGDDSGERESSIRDLVRSKVDVIVSAGTPSIHGLMTATRDIPIVMTAVSDPVVNGFIESLAHPGGNITGLTVLSDELAIKRLQLLKEAMPKIAKVAILQNSENLGHTLTIKNLVAPAGTLGLTWRVFDARRADDFRPVFAAVSEWQADATIVLDEGIFVANKMPLVDQAMQQSQPLVCGFREMAAVGCLLSYGPSNDETGYRAARYVDKIFRGAKPRDLPVELNSRPNLTW